ncbi:MAG: site-2 protease family protein [Planctomycetota bacterium]
MVDWWVADMLNDPSRGFAAVLAWVVVVIGSITLHELAHGWAAVRLGDDTPIVTGHMTWNPLVHLGMFSLIVFALIGIAWGAMPINPSRIRGRHGVALVTFAGPAMNFALALASGVLFALWVVFAPKVGIADPLLSNFEFFFFLGVMLNIVLGLFNLAPIVPLDGGRILAEYSPAYARFADSQNGRWVMLGGFMLLFAFGAEYIMRASGEIGGAFLAVLVAGLKAIVP